VANPYNAHFWKLERGKQEKGHSRRKI